MSYKVRTLPQFDKDLKRLVKKYPSLKAEYLRLIASLEANPTQGESLGNNCYKIRIAIAAANKGKRGGGRVITDVLVTAGIVYLLTLYVKNEAATVADSEIAELLKSIPAEFGADKDKDKDKSSNQ